MSGDGGESFQRPRGWRAKFGCALRGLRVAVAGHASFLVHLPVAGAVFALAAALQLDDVRWCLLLLSVTVVLTAELLNSCLEHLSRAVDRRHNEHLRDTLDIAAAAVLAASLGAMATGLIVLLPPLLARL